ncbi:osmoprotectant transport system substrate-binding protein [Enterococcus sp. PF1-24]|uniref:glycine betaine ABC transporter substrate-binding protein n=1 Tax=unclassified Enterococcus TaxID=2608891 RepID=UPI002475A355|nr:MULTISPECIES: glycine betaine ABC transporter substrate-binding protein [unclassified Enterococcus]MDH6364397.1 osmoprotectant transport system substrate-binding protein [Enterococcus sp. PFB1-1]MDH6401414.1 osmoprotectant transport system substrate-binding protein [Enterococcus sp. PF1-24]
MKRKLFALVSALFLFAGCNSNENAEGPEIKIGSKDFTENAIVSEIYALALEEEGYQVERVQNISGSLVHTAIVNGEIDLYPEYTGTGLLTILQMELETDPEKTYQLVKENYDQEFEITWLDYAEANDGQGLVIRADLAKELGITTISDLQKNATKLNFASQGEFDKRDDGLPLLEKVYGDFDWQSSKIYDNGLKYEILANEEADVTPVYTTEGQLTNTDQYLLLVDDQKVWPPYNLAPIVRNETLTENPEIATILNDISAKLDTETLQNLNAKVDLDKLEVEEVAEEFFQTLK